jgi:hypothetical protein
VRIAAGTLDIRDQGLISVQSISPGDGGSIEVDAGVVKMAGGASITAASTLDGDAGSITIKAEDSVNAEESLITTEAHTGAGGTIEVEATSSIDLTATKVSATVTGGTDVTRAPANVSLRAGQDLTLTQGTTVSARSDGVVAAGNVFIGGVTSSSAIKQENGETIPLVNTIRLENSTVTTNSSSILIDVNDSKIESEIAEGTRGGNIDLDPQFIVLQGETVISARSAGGGGGGTVSLGRADTTIITDSARDAASFVDVSSVGGQAGEVIIRGAIQSLSQEVAPPKLSFPSVARLFASRCAAQQEGQFSSIVARPPDGLPPAPGNFFPSPLSLDEPGGFLSQEVIGGAPPRLAATRLGFAEESWKLKFPSKGPLLLSSQIPGCSR